MGYFPDLLPGGGAGLLYMQSYTGKVSSAFSGTVISVTLPAGTAFIKFKFDGCAGGLNNKGSYVTGEALLNCGDHSLTVVSSGARMGLSTPEYFSSETKTLLSNTPGVLLSLPEHQINISAYTGAGNNITVSGSSVNQSTLDPVGRLNLSVLMTLFRTA